MRGTNKIFNELTELGSLVLRKAAYRDEHFLQQLFLSCRPHLAQIPLPQTLVDALVRQQYVLQLSDYKKKFPGYLNLMVLHKHEPIGNLKIHWDSRVGCLRILDIGLLAEYRSQGYGRGILRELQNLVEKNQWILCLSVDHQNWQAKKLYKALNFRMKSSSATHAEMIWDSVMHSV